MMVDRLLHTLRIRRRPSHAELIVASADAFAIVSHLDLAKSFTTVARTPLPEWIRVLRVAGTAVSFWFAGPRMSNRQFRRFGKRLRRELVSFDREAGNEFDECLVFMTAWSNDSSNRQRFYPDFERLVSDSAGTWCLEKVTGRRPIDSGERLLEPISKLPQEDADASEPNETEKVDRVSLPAIREPAIAEQPREQALDLPAPHVATQHPAILGPGPLAI